MGAFRWLAHLLARVLHGVARVLEGGRADPLDAATAALAERFPGAPDHWLRYIASRAPHLAAARVDVAPADLAISKAYSPSRRLRWWWPQQNENREPPLRLAPTPVPAAGRHEPVTTSEARRESTTKRPGSSSSATRRARLRIVGGKSGSPSAAMESPNAGGDARQESRGDPGTPPRERVRRPGLRIATITERTRAELYLDVPPQKQSSQEPQFLERRIREPARAPFSAVQRDRIAPALEFGEQPERTAPEVPAWWAASPQRPDSELRLSTRRTTAGKAGPIVSWGGEGRRQTIDQFPSSETGRDHWPELLPPEPSDIDNAPAPTPDMTRLRDEQDFGAWSG